MNTQNYFIFDTPNESFQNQNTSDYIYYNQNGFIESNFLFKYFLSMKLDQCDSMDFYSPNMIGYENDFSSQNEMILSSSDNEEYIRENLQNDDMITMSEKIHYVKNTTLLRLSYQKKVVK